MVSTKKGKMIRIITLILQGIILLLLLRSLGGYASSNINRLYIDTVLNICRLNIFVSILSIALVIAQIIRPSMTDKRGLTLLLCLLQCVTVSLIIYHWEYIGLTTIYYPLACTFAVLICALQIYTLALTPWVYMVSGAIFAVLGVIKIINSGWGYFLDIHVVSLVVGVALLICGFVRCMQKKTSESISEPIPELEQPASKFCRHCGAKVEPDNIYCVECGEKL